MSSFKLPIYIEFETHQRLKKLSIHIMRPLHEIATEAVKEYLAKKEINE